MEIKVYYECGDVESHQIPEYVGSVYSREEREMVRTITEAHADEVTEVVERVYVREGKGVFLSRWIRYAERPDPWTEPGTRTANHASKLCIVSADRMAQVSRVTVDDDLSDGALPSDVCSTLKG